MDWLNGKKTNIGALITIATVIAMQFGFADEVADMQNIYKALEASGVIVMIVGLVHKLVKRFQD